MKIIPIHTGYFKLDGGGMFGIVPKSMWEKLNPPDAQNLCTWAARALLIDNGKQVILIDTGMGTKYDEKFKSHFHPHGKETLHSSLAQAGYTPDQVTDVLLTHLHFDHCGGALEIGSNGQVQATFPNATYWSNQKQWDWAMHPNERERASFLKENFVPLHTMGHLRMIDTKQGIKWMPDISIKFLNGHTEALMAPVIRTPKGQIIYCADALPSQWHIGMPYVMAYDIRPLVTLKEKEKLFAEATRTSTVLFLEHDPVAECCTIQYDQVKKRYAAKETGFLQDLSGYNA